MRRVEIIAEGALEHCGSPALAYKLVDAAKEAGADIVKFQTYDVDRLLRPEDPGRWMLKNLQLPRHTFVDLARYAREIGIEFMSTPGDLDSLKFLVGEVGVQRIKIGSDDLTYHPLLEAAAATDLPIVLSTGMATMAEIRSALICSNITLLHCVSAYPTEAKDANLLAMKQLNHLGLPVGYSDHTIGVMACIAAAALGADMLEKHLTLGAAHPGPDRVVSLDPMAFKFMVSSVREVEQLLGAGLKVPCQAEVANIARFRKDKDGFRGLLS